MTGPTVPSLPLLLLFDKPMAITNLHILIPVKLDIDEMNYLSWITFFPHIFARSSSKIFTTLAKPLQSRIVDVKPQTDKEAWDLLAHIFQDKKRTRSLALKAGLRSLKLGDLSMDAYFQKIESIASVLKGLGSPLSYEYIVNIALEGLPSKYDNVYGIIVHQEFFPDLKTVRSMLTTEEMRLRSQAQDTFVDSTSLPHVVLMANTRTNTRRPSLSMEKPSNEEAETEPNVWDDEPVDVNPFGERKHRYVNCLYQPRRNDHARDHDDRYRDDPIRNLGLKIEIPEFTGKVHPDDFIDWLSTVEWVFDVRDIPDKLKVKLVAIKLLQHASLWWDHVNKRQ
ncbi:hybrid signal transduction histidine kinase M [Tanacetum coccineum]|uniref:Hybrid signal transduction histidine kinase M n=1 Tax=Tanacetum coccineum TaxID=301880 RepID=A0ABQ5BDP1_9ASTR